MKNWLRRWLSPTALTEEQRVRVSSLATELKATDQLLMSNRLVVVDVETTGLSLQRDQVIAIGAVAVENGAIRLADQFSVTLSGVSRRSGETVLLHGLSPSKLAQGIEPAPALINFLEFVGESPLLAFHAPFDQHMLEKTIRSELDLNRKWLYWDVAEIAQCLLPEVASVKMGLDEWLDHFKLQVSSRHQASADAMATAELLLVLLHRLGREGVITFAELDEKLKLTRKLHLHRI